MLERRVSAHIPSTPCSFHAPSRRLYTRQRKKIQAVFRQQRVIPLFLESRAIIILLSERCQKESCLYENGVRISRTILEKSPLSFLSHSAPSLLLYQIQLLRGLGKFVIVDSPQRARTRSTNNSLSCLNVACSIGFVSGCW